MYSIRPYQPYSFRCWFSNNPVRAIVVSVLPQDLVFLRSFHSIINFVLEALWCCSLQPIFLFCQDRVLFVLILLTGVSCPLFEFFPSCQVLPPFSTGVPPEIVLTLCAIRSIVPEEVYCCFHQVSPHLVKFMFNSFQLQSECCPNYIILNPSLSGFNRSGFNIYLALQPHGFRNVHSSSFLTECFRLCSPSLYSFLEFVQPLKVIWIHSFVKGAT